jgi:predicted nucleotidyltransferase
MGSEAVFRTDALGRPDLPPALARVIERFVRAFAPEAILLFGSYAKGTAQPASDVDLLIIAELSGDAAFHLRRAQQLATDCFPPIDIVFATPAEVAEAATVPSPFLHSILGRGQVVFIRRTASGLGETPACTNLMEPHRGSTAEILAKVS